MHRTRLALSLSRLRRSTVVLGATAALAATLSGLVAKGVLDEAVSARDRWGVLVAIDVVAHDVRAGTAISNADVRRERRPAALLPAGAVPAGAAAGRTARVDLVAGEVVVDSRLASALVPAGWLALAIPPPGAGAHPDVEIGDAVEVLDVGSTGTGVTAASGVVVAVRTEDGMVTVAVPRADTAAVAYAATAGTAVLALSAPRPR